SLLVVLAWRAVRSPGYRYLAPRLMLGAMACGTCFVAIKVYEYHQKLAAGISPNTNAFYMYYFMLTGLHLVHAVVGLAVLTVLWALSRRQMLSAAQRSFFEGGACFWHMVDLLWIIIFPLIFLVRA